MLYSLIACTAVTALILLNGCTSENGVNPFSTAAKTSIDERTDETVAAVPTSLTHMSNGVDIGIGGAGSNEAVWALGYQSGYYGSYIWKWTGSQWVRLGSGQGQHISVNPAGRPWVVNKQGRVWEYTTGWVNHDLSSSYSGEYATDIGIGYNGSVWVLGKSRSSYGGYLYKWTGSGWTKPLGSSMGVRIDVQSDGNPIVCNGVGNFWKWNGSSWERHDLPNGDLCKDVGVGFGLPYVIGKDRNNDGGYIYRPISTSPWQWTRISGFAVRADGNYGNFVWVVNKQGLVWQYNGSWTQR